MTTEFPPFPKMARFDREIIVTEKIDGTNASIFIEELVGDEQAPAHSLGLFGIDDKLHYMAAGSRTRWITPSDDNAGFAAWVDKHFIDLKALGPGHHHGEWWGCGIQRGYGLDHKRFSLFNTVRWYEHGKEPERILTGDPRIVKMQERLPYCCDLVPVLYRGEFFSTEVAQALQKLETFGSAAAPGFPNPEGVVIYHTAGNVCFKKTIHGDKGKWGGA